MMQMCIVSGLGLGGFDMEKGVSLVEVLPLGCADVGAKGSNPFAGVGLKVHDSTVLMVEAFVDCLENPGADLAGRMSERRVKRCLERTAVRLEYAFHCRSVSCVACRRLLGNEEQELVIGREVIVLVLSASLSNEV